jgi:hypothetical protein
VFFRTFGCTDDYYETRIDRQRKIMWLLLSIGKLFQRFLYNGGAKFGLHGAGKNVYRTIHGSAVNPL